MKGEAPLAYFASSVSYGMSGPRSFSHTAASKTTMIAMMIPIHFNMRAPVAEPSLILVADADPESRRLAGLRHLGAGQKEIACHIVALVKDITAPQAQRPSRHRRGRQGKG